MLQGLAHTICVYAKKASGGGGDNTPAVVNWVDAPTTRKKFPNTLVYVYVNQRITGIDTSITLRVELSSTGYPYLYYKIDNSTPLYTTAQSPTTNSFTNIVHNGTITVSNNQYISFCNVGSSTGNQSTTVTVKNTSDGNATLDTFTASTVN